MNLNNNTAVLSESPASSKRPLQKFVREAVRKRLTAVDMPGLRVCDPWGSYLTGKVQDGSPGEHLRVDVHDGSFYLRLLTEGSLGIARSYMNGEWDSENLSQLFTEVIANERVLHSFEPGWSLPATLGASLRHVANANSRTGARRNIHAHYDLGNDFFRCFLDPTMTYSCGFFETTDSTLEAASVAKLDRICRKLSLQPEDHVLEIGTGWGSFAIHAARNYGCRITTTTISEEQYGEARRRVAEAGLNDQIEILLQDYRDLEGQFDKLVSIEMIEAVGHRYLPGYFAVCASLLKANGVMGLQVITMPEHRYEAYLKRADFIQAFIFPGSCCPALSALINAFGPTQKFRCEHLEDIGIHYARTLRHWRERFIANIEQVRALGYPPEFIRMWEYYLCYCEAGFATRYLGNQQMILRKIGA